MIVLIDNYDSFSYNLYQLIGSIVKDRNMIKVIRNDEYSVEEIVEMNPSHVIISPGPGHPKDAGIIEEFVRKCNGKFPILGVCLGHQAICEALGATVTYAKKLMHGKKSDMEITGNCPLFRSGQKTMEIARYHSLAVDENTLPDRLKVVGRTDEGEVMAVMDENELTFGLQFHPESIMTIMGTQIMEAFLEIGR